MIRYPAVMLQGQGGLEKLEVVELPLTPPGAGQLRVKVLAAGAGSTDIAMRTGKYIYAPPWPFVPGYESIGIVDALGDGVTVFKLGDRVAALTVYGSFAEYLIRQADDFVAVPAGVTDAEAVALIRRYRTPLSLQHEPIRSQPSPSLRLAGQPVAELASQFT